jgi:nucleoside-diphosphate-sugar epimerase
MSKILIVGANGFIGKEVLSYFKDGAIGIDLVSDKNILAVDITKNEEIEKIFAENDISSCIDFAGLSLPLVCEEKQDLAYKINVLGQKNILEVCSKYGVEYYYSSTTRVYDASVGTVDEKSKVSFTNYYTQTKILAEKQIKEFYDLGKLKKAVILRFSNAYGIDSNKDRLIPTIISSLKKGEITLTNANTKFDLLYLKDIPKVIELIMGKTKDFEIFNIVSGEQLTMRDIATKIFFKLNNKSKIIIKDENEIIHPVVLMKKISGLGFVPTKFDEAIDEIIDFY